MKLRELSAPVLIGHRGFSAKFPENTLASFEGAISAGVQIIEMDLTLTKDRKVVVIHDERLDRTTNGSGLVSEKSWPEIQTLDAGFWFSPSFKGETIPSLDQVLNQLGGRVLMNLEIKPEAFEVHRPPDSICRQVVAQLKARNLLDQVLVSSFAPQVLLELSELEPQLALGFLSHSPLDPLQLLLLVQAKCYSYNPSAQQITSHDITTLQQLGYPVYTYTVNDPAEQQRLFDLGVTGIFSDGPF